MNIQNLNAGKFAIFSGLRDKLGNAYEQIAGSADHRTNENNLRIIQAGVVTVIAVATGFTNAFPAAKESATCAPSAWRCASWPSSGGPTSTCATA